MKTFRFHSHHLRKHSLLFFAAILLMVSFFTAWFFKSTLSVSYQQNSLQRYIQAQQKDASALLSDTALMRKLVQHRQSREELNQLLGKKYGLFLYAETVTDGHELLFWNNQKFVPANVEFNTPASTSFQGTINGFYVVMNQKLVLPGMSNNLVAYVMIPVLHKYYLITQSSQTAFAHDETALNHITLAELPNEYPILSLDNKPLFHVKAAPSQLKSSIDLATVVLRLTALLLLLIGLHLAAEQVYRKWGGLKGLLFLGLALLAIRVILYFYPSLLSLRQFSIFDPTVYASNFFNRSLGDLLINALFLCWMVLFAWHHLGPIKKMPPFLKGRGILVGGVVGVFILVFATYQLASVVHNLVVNSKISFEVTDYSKLSIYTGFSFFILALLSLSFYYFSRLLFRFVLMAFPNLLYLYFVVALVGLIFLSLYGGYKDVLFYLPVLLWLVMYTLILTQEQAIINRFQITIAGILFWNFLFSVSLAALVMNGNRVRENQDKRSLADKIEQLNEPTKQLSLTVALEYLDNIYLKNNFHRFYREPENTFVRDSIAHAGITASNVTYNTNLYIFDSKHNGVNNYDGRTYSELNNIYNLQSKPTGAGDLFYYETSFSEFMYIIKRDVYDSTTLKGTLFILSTPKQSTSPGALYPDLFRKARLEETTPSDFIGVYRNGKLARYTGTYPFPTELTPSMVPAGEFMMVERDDFVERWYKGSNKKVIVIARKKESFIESITLFSYLFCSFLLMVAFIRFFELGARIARNWPQVDLFSRLKIRSQIHFTIIFVSILSFLVIGVATITYFIQRYQRNNVDVLTRTAAGTLSEIKKEVGTNLTAYTATSFPGAVLSDSLRKTIREIADVHNVIVNVYDVNGNLQITTDESVYVQGVMSMKMDPLAYYHLRSKQVVQRVQEESFGDFSYLSIYKAMQNSNNDTYAFLNIPSFSSQQSLKQEISNFLVTVINLNAFIVLIAGVVALFITNRITRSFLVIGNKMKEIRLGRTNEEIEWNKEDEIGELVNQYNKMVRQLEQSASALAKSEREGAWREMARQVAHEIKNPLTPMKLSIQYLQKAIQANKPNVKDLTTNVANTLIEQIDHLSKIAADFSQFANIGTKRLETFNLHHVIGSLLDLYSTNPKIMVTWNRAAGEAIMQADKTHMNRLFTNLLTNAVDACSERERCIVTIGEKIIDDELLVSITDNGDGIPKEMQAKIFTPNFTTKTSGTGLGLAMCKGIVEQAGGRIWFETEVGKGTTFFVQLPLVNTQ